MKIYRGFKFSGTPSIHEVFNNLQHFRKRIHELAILAEAQYLANEIVRDIDSDAVNEKKPINYISSAIAKMRKEQQEAEAKQHRHFSTDFDFKVMIMPYNEELYGMVFTERNAWHDEFISNTWIDDFWYADCEVPPNLTVEEWKHREAVWKGIMAPNFVPSQCGFEMDLSLEHYRWPDSKDILKQVKSFSERVNELSYDRAVGERMKIIRENDEDKADDSIFAGFFEAKEWISTEEGQKRLAEIKTEVAPKLVHLIDINVMRGITNTDPEDIENKE